MKDWIGKILLLWLLKLRSKSRRSSGINSCWNSATRHRRIQPSHSKLYCSQRGIIWKVKRYIYKKTWKPQLSSNSCLIYLPWILKNLKPFRIVSFFWNTLYLVFFHLLQLYMNITCTSIVSWSNSKFQNRFQRSSKHIFLGTSL